MNLLRTLSIVAAAIGLAIVIVQNGLSLSWAQSRPEAASAAAPWSGIARSWLAHRQMLTARDAADMDRVYANATRAAARAPLEAEASRNAGFVVAARGDEQRADKIIGAAARTSKRDYFAHAWLLDRKFRLNQIDGAVEEADIVLRQRTTSWPVIFPELTRITADPRVIEPLARALAARPYWRGTFFETFGAKAPSHANAFRLFRRLASLREPASASEQRSWFARFDGETDVKIWYLQWRTLLPEPLAKKHMHIRDGDFEGLDAPPPFTWLLRPSDGVYSERSKNPDGAGQTLYVSFEGVRATDFAVQSLPLAPGDYEIAASVFADDPIEAGKIGIHIRCGRFNSSRSIIRLGFSVTPGKWRRQSVGVTMPEDCPAPQLWIEGRQGTTLQPASLWVDNITITPR